MANRSSKAAEKANPFLISHSGGQGMLGEAAVPTDINIKRRINCCVHKAHLHLEWN